MSATVRTTPMKMMIFRVLARSPTRSCSALSCEPDQLQYAKDPKESKSPNDQERLSSREDEAQVRGQNGEKIDNAKEATRISERPSHRVETKNVLNSEEDSDQPLDSSDHDPIALADGDHALQHHGENARQNEDQESDVEGLSRRSIGLEDDLVEPGSMGGLESVLGHASGMLSQHQLHNNAASPGRISGKQESHIRRFRNAPPPSF